MRVMLRNVQFAGGYLYRTRVGCIDEIRNGIAVITVIDKPAEIQGNI